MSRSHFNARDPFGKKPAKPYDEFPLFPHDNGCWAKKIRGRLHYFGVWVNAGPDHGADAALQKYLATKDDLHAGRTPRPDPDSLTVKDACHAFLNAKQALVDAGELTPRTWVEYKGVCDLLVTHLGKSRLVADLGPDDFASLRNKLAKRWGPHRLAKAIQYPRSVFKHALDAGLIARGVCFGPGFKRPTKKVIRLHQAEQGPKLLRAEEIRRLLDEAGTPMKAMMLLGINAGFGNADCGTLPLSALAAVEQRQVALQERGQVLLAAADRRDAGPTSGRVEDGVGQQLLGLGLVQQGHGNTLRPPTSAKRLPAACYAKIIERFQ
jgi:hypothetical protein